MKKIILSLALLASLFAGALLTGCAFTEPFGSAEAAPNAVSEESTTATAAEGQDPRFVQDPVSHEGYKVNAEWKAALNEAKDAANGGLTEDAVKDILARDLGRDAQLLAMWRYSFGLQNNPNEYQQFLTEDGTYLSEEGIVAYKEIMTLLEDTRVLETTANTNGRNSGFAEGFTQNISAGISGDTKALDFYPPEGAPVQVLDRCSNFVLPPGEPVPGIPEGPTDETPPTPENPVTPEPKDPAKDPWLNPELPDTVRDDRTKSPGGGAKTDPKPEDGEIGNGVTPDPIKTPPSPPQVPDSQIKVSTTWINEGQVVEHGSGGYWTYSLYRQYNVYKDGHSEATSVTQQRNRLWHPDAKPPQDGDASDETHDSDPGEY